MKFLCCLHLSILYLYAVPKDIAYLREMYSKPPSQWEKPHLSPNIAHKELAPLPKIPPYPKDNPYSKQKAQLGEMLFDDPRLSLSNQIACASCHDKEFGFGDGRRVSYGHNRRLGVRNAPSVVMSAFGVEKFWDGRAKDLEDQALFPIADPNEMAYTPESAAKKISKIPIYKEKFKEAFGSEEITPTRIAQAIATYERSLMPAPTRFDRFLNGKKDALKDKEIWGLHLFRTKGRCMNCHNGVALSDDSYHNLGLHFIARKYEDLGRYEVTHNTDDIGKFKTPSLRGVSKTAPYMHNGLFPHLRGVLNAYNAGMFRPKAPQESKDSQTLPFPETDPLLEPLHLSDEELEALEAFLKTL
ncbi:cytochrome-c peroxidase [Helicobacter marmotae]|uniref:Methylamine utilization protein MauG n=1 Tax=Helicobacter marmotae TaxID=152490 RepID=A0A3D8I801_9HELI|nr:cytochrome c peroxidase [Helicobacter marmotae]RDU61145.1 cytochrome-c peroxidase [Helicobacter marmotae]